MPHPTYRPIVALVTAAVAGLAATAGPASAGPPAPEPGDQAGSYIVVLRDDATAARGTAAARAAVTATADALARRHGGTVGHVYSAALTGFQVRLSAPAARRLAADPAVAFVERDAVVSLPRPAPGTTGTQPGPPSWGLDRIDQRTLPLDLRYTYPNTAHNVRAYVIDTGIRMTHTDFGGRASTGIDIVDGGAADDCNGHGTAMAGVIGGAHHGVAKAVQLVAVRVLNCAGSATYAQVIAGVDWVTADHDPGEAAVANLSLGGGANAALDTAVSNSIADGVSYAVASGSSAADACNYSPARVGPALTVGGTTQTDQRRSASNYGPCLDLFAPGQSLTTTWHTSDTATATLSGSLAAAHVAGAAALVASANPTWTPAQVAASLTANATAGVVGNPGPGSPNRLLYVR